jgi:hypothetical protein
MAELRKAIAKVEEQEMQWRQREKNSMRAKVRYTGALEVILMLMRNFNIIIYEVMNFLVPSASHFH